LTPLEGDNQYPQADTGLRHSQEQRVVTAMFKQALAYFRKTWAQLRNPYRPERHYMRGSGK